MDNNKKVWILTRRAGYNFGSSLQAYAMTYIINKLGYKNQIIKFEEYRIRGKFRLLLFDLFYIFMQTSPILFKQIAPAFFSKYSDSYHQRTKFNDFEKKYFPLTSKKYKTSEAIAADAQDCNILLCGSDQIWSPIHFCATMFLDFADNERTKTIAYAPSIGLNKIEYHQDEIATLVNRIDHLSVREVQGAKLIKELTGRDAFVALDPTLLLEREEWAKIMTKPFLNEPYILCYFLDTKDIPYKFIESIRIKTGYKVVNILSNYSRINIPYACNTGTVSPPEFIGLVSKASYVCTNSFHGTIFSIQFARDFFVFNRFSQVSSINQNSRIDTLLDIVFLKERRCLLEDEFIPSTSPIDYQRVYNSLAEKRKSSIDFLSQALNEKRKV